MGLHAPQLPGSTSPGQSLCITAFDIAENVFMHIGTTVLILVPSLSISRIRCLQKKDMKNLDINDPLVANHPLNSKPTMHVHKPV